MAVEGVQREMAKENGGSDNGEKELWRELDIRCERLRGPKSGSF